MECVNHKTVETRLSFTTNSSLPLTFVTFVLSKRLGTFVLSESLGTKARLYAELLSYE